MIKTRLIKMLSHARKYIVYQVLWQWIALICQIVLMYAAVGLLWDAFREIAYGQPFSGVRYLIMIALSGAARFFANRQAAKASFEASVDVKRILRDKIYSKLLRLGASYREQVPTSEIVQLAGEGVEQLETYFGKFLSQFFYSLIAPLTLFIVLFHVSWKASLVLLVCVPLIPGVIVMVQKIAKRLLSKYWDIYADLGDSFLENLQGMTTLKIYRADEKKAEQMDAESERFRVITMKVLQMQLNSIIIMDVIAYGGAALGMIITISGYMNGEIDFPGALWIILLAVEFFLPMRRLGSFFHIAMNGMAASDKIFRLLDLPEPEEKTREISSEWTDIKIRDLCFSYHAYNKERSDSTPAGKKENSKSTTAKAEKKKNSKSMTAKAEKKGKKANTAAAEENSRDVLTDINMDFPSGSFTSLVGPSGCGKSTIAAILMGRNRGYRGSVKVGGFEISEINEKNLMKNITLVSNNSHLFKGTVAENLAMGNPEADEEMMRRALEMVNLDGFLFGEASPERTGLSGKDPERTGLSGKAPDRVSTPGKAPDRVSVPGDGRARKEQSGETRQGLAAEIAENGSNLSGGQRQRLALARALLHDSPVYIFDEATSNIDSESEEMIMKVIHRLAESRTVILISHRLANVVSSDRIYMLSGGRVIQSGTHAELMAAGDAYRTMYEQQQALENYGRGRQNAASEDKGEEGDV